MSNISESGNGSNSIDAAIATHNADIAAHLASFPGSFSGNGYQKLPSGLIIQWGKTAGLVPVNGEEIITLPVSCPNAILMVQCTPIVSAGTGDRQTAAGLIDVGAKSQFHCVNAAPSTATFRIMWMAIGN